MRSTILRSLSAAAVVAAGCAAGLPGAAHAAPSDTSPDSTTVTATLRELNDSGAGGKAMVWVKGDDIKVELKTTGMLAGAPHAQHIHIGGLGTCPASNAKGSGTDGALRVSDAMDKYGMIALSLTTKGDSSPKSGLAVDRFPTGSGTYTRTITNAKVADQVRDGKGVIVTHGVDLNGNGTYDGPGKSDLDPKLPEEATDPAACGVLMASQMSDMPDGGVATGQGGAAASSTSAALLGTGGLAAVAGGAGLLLVQRRRRSAETR